MTAFAVCRAAGLAEAPLERRWLIEGLWAAEACGIVGGEPKCGKSFLALDLAVAVASGAPALRTFPVAHTGPVLLYPAEDAAHAVRRRLEGIARVAKVAFDDLDVHVITEPELRLDLERDRERLTRTVDAIRPRLVVLDPFVRLHRVDENVAGEVAPILAGLRALQRRFATAVLVVHHARKGAAHARAGQALRGSSELHAWGDSNLYLRRHGEALTLAIEHRHALSAEGLGLALVDHGDAVALEPVTSSPPTSAETAEPTVTERVFDVLASASRPLSIRALRERCRIRTTRICDALAELAATGRVRRSAHGYEIVAPAAFPAPPLS